MKVEEIRRKEKTASRTRVVIQNIVSRIAPFLLVVAALSVWQFLSQMGMISTIILPAPTSILFSLIHNIENSTIPDNLVVSLRRLASGYFLAVGIGVPFGLLLGWNKALHQLFEPIIEFLRPIPAVALIPPAIILFGIGDESKIAIVFYATFFILVINCLYGVYGVENLQVLSFKSMYARKRDIFFKLVVPSSMPSVFAGLRIAINVGLIVLIATEMVLSSAGIGYFIIFSQQSFHFEAMYAGIVVLSILGYTFNKVILAVEHRLLWWAQETKKMAQRGQ